MGNLAALVAMLACLTAPVAVRGTDAGQDVRDVKVSIRLENVGIRSAVAQLFKGIGASYCLDPAVEGLVTVDYADVPFESALRGLLDQVGGTFEVEAGIYLIKMKGSVGQLRGSDGGTAISGKNVSVRVEHADFRDALKLLFQQIGASYSINPAVQGQVTVDLADVPLESALRAVLDQVNATFRVDSGVYMVIPKASLAGSGDAALPTFIAGTPSGTHQVRNKGLFLTPHRTMGGTFDLLAEAAGVAGYERWQVCEYGGEGFALVLPLEALDGSCRALRGPQRFAKGVGDWTFDFRHIAGVWRREPESDVTTARRVVLLVTPEPIRPNGSIKISDHDSPPKPTRTIPYGSDSDYLVLVEPATALPPATRARKWTREPKLTVLVYELRSETPGGRTVLLKKGESKVGAKAHIVDSGLWTAKQMK